MVDWSLARQIARFAAGRPGTPRLGHDMDVLASDAAGHVAAYTQLAGADSLPRAEVIGREEWAETNLDTLAELLDPVAERLQGRLGAAGPLAGALRTAAGATLAAEAGLVVGYMSQRVLGQFELSLLAPEVRPRLLFVAPNLDGAIRRMGLDRESFLSWVALHEVTHVLQFGGVRWLREHLGGLLKRYLETVEVRIERGAAGALPAFPDPARIVEAFREGGLMALIQTREQRRLMSEVQATMAVIEGYSEHVMDAVGERVLDTYEGLREAMDQRRRTRSAPERVLQRLLGLDLKLRQYELGKRFCDAVAERWGLAALNQVWDRPEALPTLPELERPAGWVARVTREPAALAT
jgi:coenzyme F420 biosynthesis associated uncharacterized protein